MRIPYGFTLTSSGTLEINRSEANVVRMIFDFYMAAGYEFVKGKTGDLALSLLDKNAPPWRKVKVKWACFANP